MGKSVEDYLDLASYYGFHVLVIVLPLLISYRITYDQFDLPKLTFLRIITVFLLFCFAAKSILQNRVEIKRTELDYPILIFLLLIAASTVFSVHITTSLFGKYKRYEGLLTFVNYGLLFFLAAQFFTDLNKVKSIARSMVIAAGAVSVYGLLQPYGFDLLTWASLPFESSRSFSTFGNPVLLGGYLVIVLPVALGLVFSEPDLKRRFLFGLPATLIFLCLMMTFSRGGWLGACLVLVGFLVLGWKEFADKKVILTISVLILVSTVILFPFSFTRKAEVDFRERISPGISITGSAQTRLEIWKSAAKMIRERPILGFGPDTFRLVFRKYQTLKYKRLVGESAVADNAHNYFLQLASMTGVPAAVCFIVIITLFFVSAFKLLVDFKGRRDYFIFSGFALSIPGYLLDLLFGVSVVGSTSFLWLILGMIAGFGSSLISDFEWRNSLVFRGFSMATGTLAASLLISLAILPFLGDFHFAGANKLASTGYYARSVDEYKKAFLYFPYYDNYHYELGAFNMKWALATKEKKYFDAAIGALEMAVKVNPLETDNHFQLASMYDFGAGEFDPRYYAKSINELNDVLVLEPYSSHAYFLLGSGYIDGGAFNEAVKNLKKAVDITPNFEDAYFYLGIAFEKLGRVKDASAAYRRALSLNPKNWGAKEPLERIRSQKNP